VAKETTVFRADGNDRVVNTSCSLFSKHFSLLPRTMRGTAEEVPHLDPHRGGLWGKVGAPAPLFSFAAASNAVLVAIAVVVAIESVVVALRVDTLDDDFDVRRPSPMHQFLFFSTLSLPSELVREAERRRTGRG